MNGKLRNKPCPCGSGKKYKHCCMRKDQQAHQEELRLAAEETTADVTKVWELRKPIPSAAV